MRLNALRMFANPEVRGPRPDGLVLPGDVFETSDVHAADLLRAGLAEPHLLLDPRDKDKGEDHPAEKRKPREAGGLRGGV